MIKGMTGFGGAKFKVGQIKGIIEIKTVNHRFLDMAFYLPVGFGTLEGKIRDMVSSSFSRGRVTISVKILDKAQQEVKFNERTIAEYLKHSKTLARKYHLNDDLTLADLIKMPGVVEVKEVFVEASVMWPEVQKGIRQALKSAVVMRQREGKSLTTDLMDKFKRMSARLKEIEKRSDKILKSKRGKMSPEEFSSFQKGIDINEELARFSHYIEEAKGQLKSKVPVGKKLDFIAQEMQRETNTMGSKLQDDLVSNAVIGLKSKIEKVREQANNIE